MLLPEPADRHQRLRDILRRELVARGLDGERHTWNKWMKRIHHKEPQVFSALVVCVSIHHCFPTLNTRANDNFGIRYSFVTTFPFWRVELRPSETDELVASLVPSRFILTSTFVLRTF